MPLIDHPSWKKPAPGAKETCTCNGCTAILEYGFCETCPISAGTTTTWSAYVPAQVFVGEGKWNHEQREEDDFRKELDQ